MPGPLTDEEVRVGSAGMAWTFLLSPFAAASWALTHNFWATIGLGGLTFFGAVHLVRHFQCFLDRWSQLRAESHGIIEQWHAFNDALPAPQWQPPGFRNRAPIPAQVVEARRARAAKANARTERRASRRAG